MTVKTELIKGYISDIISSQLVDFDIDEEKIADTRALKVLSEIQDILKNDSLTDFEMVDSIVSVFAAYNLDFGACHDF